MVQCLLELHCVQVFIDETEGASNEIFGRIILDDSPHNFIDIFNEEKEHAKSISSDGILPLSGPFRCIIGNTCGIAVSLKEKCWDLEVSNACISFEGGHSPIDYDRPISLVFKGEHGYAIFHVSLFDNAKQAIVEILFVPNEGRPKPQQYTISGTISAQYSSYRYKSKYSMKYHQTMLFDITKENAMTFNPDEVIKIPLSRPAVAVPWNDWLVIDTNLWVNDSRITGIPLFFPGVDGCTTVEYIEGNFGHIKVSVSWLSRVKT